MDRRERVASALFYKLELEGRAVASGDHWAGLQRSSKRKWLEAADAALAAADEPNPLSKEKR